MRPLKIGKIDTTITALKRRQIKELVKEGFRVSTTSLVYLEGHQWDDFIDALVRKYCPSNADAIIKALDGLAKDERRAAELELVAETWGAEEEEKN